MICDGRGDRCTDRRRRAHALCTRAFPLYLSLRGLDLTLRITQRLIDLSLRLTLRLASGTRSFDFHSHRVRGFCRCDCLTDINLNCSFSFAR